MKAGNGKSRQPVGQERVEEADRSREGHRARLRQRFMRSGLEGFAEHEVVELLLTLCIPRRDVKPPAKALLKRFGSLYHIFNADEEALREVAGLGEVTVAGIRIIREIAGQVLLEKAQAGGALNDVDKLLDLWIPRLRPLKHEVFELALLDNSYHLLREGLIRLEEGVVDRATVYPRKVAETALRKKAACVVIAHNHPAGAAEPSERDVTLTGAIADACRALDLRLLDHLIVARAGTFSFLRAGML